VPDSTGPDLGPFRTTPPRLEPPPRHVPLLLRVRLLLGDDLALFGWLFLGFSLPGLYFLVREMDRSLFSLVFVVLFPLLGVVLVLRGIPRGRRRIELLRSGRPALGRLVDRRETNVTINDEPVIALTFEFTTEDGLRSRVVERTHRPQLLEDDEEEPLLYDARWPERAALLDHLPGAPRVDSRGRLHVKLGPRTFLPLLLPLAVIVEVVVVVARLTP
jgi:hypothetical protein